jgi:hypothetical protein
MSVIPAMWKVQVGGLRFKADPRVKMLETLSKKTNLKKQKGVEV